MSDLAVKLNPITKLRLYRTAKKVVFAKMDKDIITPERADEILGYVKDNVTNIPSPEAAKAFYESLAQKFPELVPMKETFELEIEEKVQRIFGILIEHLMNKGKFDLASQLMDEINELKDPNAELLMAEKLEKEMPKVFEEAVNKVK